MAPFHSPRGGGGGGGGGKNINTEYTYVYIVTCTVYNRIHAMHICGTRHMCWYTLKVTHSYAWTCAPYPLRALSVSSKEVHHPAAQQLFSGWCQCSPNRGNVAIVQGLAASSSSSTLMPTSPVSAYIWRGGRVGGGGEGINA